MNLWMDGVADPVALIGKRELEIIPWHFTVITLNEKTDVRKAREWVWKNLTGRFGTSGPSYTFRSSRGSGYKAQFGFEDPLEASAFILTEPLLTMGDDF